MNIVHPKISFFLFFWYCEIYKLRFFSFLRSFKTNRCVQEEIINIYKYKYYEYREIPNNLVFLLLLMA